MSGHTPFALVADEDRRELEKLPGVVDAFPLTMGQAGMLVEMRAEAEVGGGPVYWSRRTFAVGALSSAGSESGEWGDGRRPAAGLGPAGDGRRPATELGSADGESGEAREPIDAERLGSALAVVGARHVALRSSLELGRFSVPLQVVHERVRVSVETGGVGAFDPGADPLVRVVFDPESQRVTFVYCDALFLDAEALFDELIAYCRSGVEQRSAEADRCVERVIAEREALASAQVRAYWQNVIDTCVPLSLPDAWAQSDADSHAARYRFEVPFADLRPLAALAETSLKSVLLAAHLKVMSALTTEEAFHTGVRADENVLAFPHRGRPATWLDLVRQTHTTLSQSLAHGDYPMPALQRAAGGSRRLVDVLFGHEGFSDTEFALTVTVLDDRLLFTARCDAADRAHSELLAGLYRSVLVAMAADPLGDAAGGVLSGEVLEQAVQGSDGPVVPYSGVPVHEAFEATADASPDVIAVVTGDGVELSYREVDARANQIAHRLRSLGVGPGVLVGVCLERGADLVPALLGVLKAGAGYLPLDPGYPAERLGWILADADAPVLLCEAATQEVVGGAFTGTCVLVEDTRGESTRRLGVASHLLGVVYTIYTSGSTGRPKGVVLTHADLGNFIAAFGGLLPDGGRGVWLASTSVSFDISNLELWLPLTCGGSVVVAGRGEAGDPVALNRLIEAYRVDYVQATPSGWRMLLAAGFDRPEVTALAGGEELPAALAGEIRGRVGRLLNVYGPTEATVWASTWEVPAAGWSTVKLGVPLANYSWFVLDRFGYPVPPGAAGELHIGGESLARGYLGRPDLTADRFVPDPFGAPGARLYRTGDLARRLSDGSVEFLGRIDTQVKIRGYRIELGEIESALTTHPRIRQAIVSVRGDTLLAAHIVSNGRIDATRLRQYLAATLPSYMVPSIFVPIERIPLNPAGKADRKALPWPDHTDKAAQAPLGAAQEAVATCWKDVLGTAPTSVDHDFFQAGGTSVLAVRLADRLRQEFGCDVGVREVMQNATVARLAEAVAK